MKAPKVQEQLEQTLLPAGIPVHQPRVSGRPPEPARLSMRRLFLVGVGRLDAPVHRAPSESFLPPGGACAGSQGLSTLKWVWEATQSKSRHLFLPICGFNLLHSISVKWSFTLCLNVASVQNSQRPLHFQTP